MKTIFTTSLVALSLVAGMYSVASSANATAFGSKQWFSERLDQGR